MGSELNSRKNACDKGMQFVQQGMSNKSSVLESFKAARKKIFFDKCYT